ncbi:hypothetical protein COCMIDRAFT_7170 [Bipolaris oryzae ATCC 44560]|uniref:Uncharacterized protein n=1 Tax=Bipolaris oryzae ATCC 44560 TaxID=930090 RepID=W6Z0E6_COCMI|nr:uncharacterized protein COCMIDRAFT_7170 [Bipolaris oryzae ATCC 44560]EUC43410.1 hypothetical protein COCMIDRAFT_7170 [Bipolaris oryzae ATCC 44560]
MAVGLGETITVINKSGKVVSSSKHIFGVFKEAKAAYRERKAEIKAERDAAVKEKELSKSITALRIDDDTRSQTSHRSKASKSSRRPPLERGHTDVPRSSRHRFEADLNGQDSHGKEVARRHSDQPRAKAAYVDMDLAYGDVPPPLPDPQIEELELKEKASKIEMLLDEANALQYTATAIIENLQKNPEALAAVSLTLAEISALVTKMGPGVLMSLKGSFPAVAALLLSPQFMIAGGVAVGVTIVALGGYKIIKKIQTPNQFDPLEAPAQPMISRAATAPAAIEEPSNELDELQPQELSRVEKWRRGIADIEAESCGTSVDGEFITPGVSRELCDAGILDEDDLKSRRSTRSKRTTTSESRHKSHRSKSKPSESKSSESKRASSKVGKDSSSKVGKDSSSKVGKDSASKVGSSRSGKESSRKKEKEPSGLKMLFRSHTVAA